MSIAARFVHSGLLEALGGYMRAAVGRAEPDAAQVCVATWFRGDPPAAAVSPAPLVRWWVGTDVSLLAQGKTAAPARDAAHNWAVSPWLVDELGRLDVAARMMPILPTWEARALPLSAEPIVLAYAPEGREGQYRWQDILAVAEALPDVQFRAFRRSAPAARPNVTCLPLAPHSAMPEEYARARAILRLTTHDGLSVSVLEAMCLGRHVVWSHPFPFCHYATTVDAAATALRNVLSDVPNHDGVNAFAILRRHFLCLVPIYLTAALEHSQ